MRLPTKCIVFLACWATVLATPAKIDDADFGGDSSVRDPKLLFSFITIAPENCTAASTTTRTGVCYSAADCTTLAGVADGTCAKGLGVCCLITRTCGATSSFRETSFINPTYPTAQPAALGRCTLTVTPANNNICQLRLDFEDFSLSQPNNDGVCAQDVLQVTAGSSIYPKICGENTGQHMYLDVSPQSGSAVINVDTASVGSKWKIKVTQIECNSADRAPAGCLQYFTSTQGTFSNFNFNPASAVAPVNPQLANHVYGICIKSQPGYCSITYRQDGTVFSVSGTPGVVAPGLTQAVVGVDCTTDYLIIPGGAITPDAAANPPLPLSGDRFCGLAFPTVTSSVQPFAVYYVSNGVEETTDGELDNKGFRIMYRMNAC